MSSAPASRTPQPPAAGPSDGEEPGSRAAGERLGGHSAGERPRSLATGEQPGGHSAGEQPKSHTTGEQPGGHSAGEEPGDHSVGEQPGGHPASEQGLPARGPTSRARLHAYGLMVAIGLASLSPLVRKKDDFPLSSYPMFATRRPDVAWIARAVAIEASSGRPIFLRPSLIASDEPMQAVSTLRKTLARGASESAALCREIAARVALEAGDLSLAHGIRLEWIKVPVIGYFRGETEPVEARIASECPIVRRPDQGP